MTKNELKKMTKKELLELAKSKNIPVATRMLKADMVNTISKEITSGGAKRTPKKFNAKKKTSTKGRPAAKKTVVKKSRKSSKATVHSVSTAPQTNHRTIRQKAVAGKYHLTKTPHPDLLENEVSNLPEYDITRIACMVRDPHWIFTYWKISSEQYNELRKTFGSSWPDCKTILRVYDHSGDAEISNSFDIETPDGSENWYINVSEKCKYKVGIGIISPDGVYKEIAVSALIETPPDGVSSYSDEEWAVPDTTFNQILTASGDLKERFGSEEHLKAKAPSSVNSEIVSSFSNADSNPAESSQPSVKVELVVYGTSSDASRISLMGKRIETNEDGSFSIRMALPEGELELPIKLVSSDCKWEKIIKARIETEEI